jgi:hypothetical protein
MIVQERPPTKIQLLNIKHNIILKRDDVKQIVKGTINVKYSTSSTYS